MGSYRLSGQAEADLDGIAVYTTLRFGAAQARKYKTAIIQSVETAATFPAVGRAYTTGAGERFRRYNVGRHAIFYRIDDDGIFVARILHQMMDFDRHL